MSRKTAREVTMKLAFARMFDGECEETYQEVLDKSGINEAPTEEDICYSQEVLKGISELINFLELFRIKWGKVFL